MEAIRDIRRVQRVRHELRRREVEVARVEPLGSELVRVVFAGPELEGFTSLGFDDHVKFIAGDAGGGEPGRRDYTPRRYDAARHELTIDFALHGAGIASDWARAAKPGDKVVIGGPKGSMIVPTDYPWHLLAGDATAIPAITRRLEELPPGTRVYVIAQIADTTPLDIVRSGAGIERHVVADGDAFIAALRALPLPSNDGYAWCAGEASTMARARDVLLVEKAHPREAMRVAAYWKRGASDYHDDLGR